MTDEQMCEHFEKRPNDPLVIRGGDYIYGGWLVSTFRKRHKGVWRCVVEDMNGRLFIHNASQLSTE